MSDLGSPAVPAGQDMIAPEKLPGAAQPPPPAGMAPAIQQDQGEGAQKKSPQIIHDYVLKQSGDPKAAEAVMKALADMIDQKVARLIQFGNTVFWATQKGPQWVDVHIFSEESPRVMVKRIQQAYEWAKAHGFKKITSTLVDGEFVKILKMAGVPYTAEQTTVNDGTKMIPAYLMTMEVR